MTGLERSEIFPSLRFAPAWLAAPPADFPLTFESMLLELERCPLRAAAAPLDDLAGLGRERYCRVTLEPLQLSRTASSCGCDPSRLVLRTAATPAPFPIAAEDLGALPRVAEPLVRVAPLEVIRAPVGPGIFLYPKEPAAGGRAMPEGGFLPSSPLLFPASEGERWMPAELLEGTLTFSEALASSVLPANLHKAVIRSTFLGHCPFSNPAMMEKSQTRLRGIHAAASSIYLRQDSEFAKVYLNALERTSDRAVLIIYSCIKRVNGVLIKYLIGPIF